MEGLFSLQKAMARISREPMAQRRYNGFFENALLQIGLLAEMIRCVKADTRTLKLQKMFFNGAAKPLETEQTRWGFGRSRVPGWSEERPSILPRSDGYLPEIRMAKTPKRNRAA
jgi:hypothetical protein